MKTKTIKIYRFKELKKDIQEKVLNKFREKKDFEFLQEDLTEILKEKLEENKIKFFGDLKVFYSLSYCQGDGFCFIGTFETANGEFVIKHNGHYYHSNSTDINLISVRLNKNNWRFSEDITIKNEARYNLILQNFKDKYYIICKEMEKIGYNIIEEEESDEAIKDLIEMNNYYFRENGSIENDLS